MISEIKLKNILLSNDNIILDILHTLGCHGARVEYNRIQFGCKENTSSRSHCIFLDEFLTHKDFSSGITESFFKMISRLKNFSYQDTIGFVSLFITGTVEVTDGVYETRERKDIPLDSYPKEVLNTYQETISELFIKDGITPSTQKKFNIRFSEKTNRVLIPIMQKGELVGIFGRYNQKKVNASTPKWYPILPYQKSKVLFPFDENKNSIIQSKICYLVESEKTPLLVNKWSWNNILALGGNCIKQPQIDLLKELNVETVVVCLDKGLDTDMSVFMCERLKEQGFYVYYIDSNNIDILPNKECVFDLNNKEVVEQMIKKHIKRA